MGVELERRTVRDLLPDWNDESVAAWLRAHPGIKVIARDRADFLVEGGRADASQA